MASDRLGSIYYVLLIAGPVIGLGLLLFNFVVSCGPGGYGPEQSPPRGFQHLVIEWQKVGIAYGNGCEVAYPPVILFGGLALICAGFVSFVTLWRKTEQ